MAGRFYISTGPLAHDHGVFQRGDLFDQDSLGADPATVAQLVDRGILVPAAEAGDLASPLALTQIAAAERRARLKARAAQRRVFHQGQGGGDVA